MNKPTLCNCGFPQSFPLPHEHDRTDREAEIIKYFQLELDNLEDKNNEIWEDGYSFGIYKVKEMIEEIIGDGKIAYNKELDILKEKINKLKLMILLN